MGLIELLILVLVILWALGYLGRGRLYGRGGDVSDSNLIHSLLVIVVILVILRLLRLI